MTQYASPSHRGLTSILYPLMMLVPFYSLCYLRPATSYVGGHVSVASTRPVLAGFVLRSLIFLLPCPQVDR